MEDHYCCSAAENDLSHNIVLGTDVSSATLPYDTEHIDLEVDGPIIGSARVENIPFSSLFESCRQK